MAPRTISRTPEEILPLSEERQEHQATGAANVSPEFSREHRVMEFLNVVVFHNPDS
jgi:hypothetical protein